MYFIGHVIKSRDDFRTNQKTLIMHQLISLPGDLSNFAAYFLYFSFRMTNCLKSLL